MTELNDDEEIRPITLHVNKIVYNASLTHTYRKRVTVVDLELSRELAQDMVDNFQKLLTQPRRGSFRVRFKGSLVLE